MTTESNRPVETSGASAPEAGVATSPRARPLLALGAGLLMPGLGQVYAGEPVRGAAILLAVGLAVPIGARLALAGPARLLCFVALLGMVVAVGLYVCSAINACRLARKPGPARQPWQRWGVYALYIVAGYLFVLSPLTARARGELLETFVVPSASMTPGILPGDRILADKTVGSVGGARLWRGALAIFVSPNDRTSIFIKRVVGLPGDRIELGQGRLVVNGRDVAVGSDREQGDRGDYEVRWPREEADVRGLAPEPPLSLVVPPGQAFVLGDNRAAAVDSRRFGTVPLSDVKGIARQIWFSSHAGAGVRWSRVGKLLH
jgi:signal peptidase I